MKIEIEIPEEFEKDYTADKFADFLGRVRADIDYNGMCGNYERETADVLAEAFKNSKVIQEVAYKGGRLVDADKLYNDLADKLKWLMGYGDDVYLSAGDDIRCAVANQPTAYDPDKVVEQLEEIKTGANTNCNRGCSDYDWSTGTCQGLCEEYLKKRAIEIVKAGGVDGN